MEPKMTVSEAAAFLNVSVQAIHKRIKSKELTVKRKQNRFYFGHETARLLFNLHFSNKVYALQNIKGGVGKSEETFCFSVRSNLYGARVLVIDLDPQGNLTKNAFKIIAKDKPIMIDVIRDSIPVEQAIVNVMPGLDLIPSYFDNTVLDTALLLGRFPLNRVYKDIIDKLKPNYDAIFIDCPPALNASVTAAILASDEVIAPVEPDDSALDGLFRLEEEIADIKEKYKVEIPLRIVFNFFDARTTLSDEKWHFLKNSPKYGQMLYRPYIRTSQDFPNARGNGITIFDSFRITTAKEDIDSLTKQILRINAPEITNIEE